MRAKEFIVEVSSQGGIAELEKQLDKMFMPLGMDVEFSRHFIERLLGREREVTVGEVVSAFQKLKTRYKRQLLKAKKTDAGPGALQDFDSDLNVLFAIQPDKQEGDYDLVNITVKRKDPDQFHTDTPSGKATPYKVGSKKQETTEATRDEWMQMSDEERQADRDAEEMPSVKTFSVKEIASKHGVPYGQIASELSKGTQVELEHTTNKTQAREIALDHLLELPDYYTRLAKMEQGK